MTIHRSSRRPGLDARCCRSTDDPVEVPDVMRALEAKVVDAVWEAVEGLLRRYTMGHPLGCHRPRLGSVQARRSRCGGDTERRV